MRSPDLLDQAFTQPHCLPIFSSRLPSTARDHQTGHARSCSHTLSPGLLLPVPVPQALTPISPLQKIFHNLLKRGPSHCLHLSHRVNCLETVAQVFAVSPRPPGPDHTSSVQNLGLPQRELPLVPSSGPCSLFVHTSMIPHVIPQSCSFIHLLDTQIKTTQSLPIRSSEEQSFPTSLSPVSSAQPPPVPRSS